MRKICFIINPISGEGKSAHSIPIIKKVCETHSIEYAIKISKDEFEVETLSRDAADNGFTEIIAVGGDGTLREVLSGMYEKNIRLGLIPTGTGNDFAITAGIPAEIEKAMQVVIEGYTERIDVATSNGKPFLNVLSWGIDSEIIKNLPKFKRMFKGKESYLISAINTIMKYRPIRMKYKIDDQSSKITYIALAAIGNGKYFGGGMKITPDAVLDDGMLDLCIIEAMPKLKLLRFFPKVFSGTHIDVAGVSYIKCKKIEMEILDISIDVNMDGDLFDEKKVTVLTNNRGVDFLMQRKTAS